MTISETSKAIQAVLDEHFRAYIDKDLDEMLSCYAPDLVTMMPVGLPTHGLEEWRQVLEGAFERGDVLELVSDTQEILVLGDWAWVWYFEWAKRRRVDTGEHLANFIRAAMMMQRQLDGEWKIARYIANAVNLEKGEDFDEHVARTRAHAKAHAGG